MLFNSFRYNFGLSSNLKSERFVKDILQKSLRLLPPKMMFSKRFLASILGAKFIQKSIPRGIENYIIFNTPWNQFLDEFCSQNGRQKPLGEHPFLEVAVLSIFEGCP